MYEKTVKLVESVYLHIYGHNPICTLLVYLKKLN